MVGEKDLGQNIIFVGGCPRSGTTLLQRMIGAHPAIFSMQEFQFMPHDIVGLRERMHQAIDIGNIDKIATKDSVDAGIRSLVQEIFDRSLSEHRKEKFCEKTPDNALRSKEILEIFPKSKVVLIVRDPREVVNSMKSVRNRYLKRGIRPPRYIRSVAQSIIEINKYFEKIFSANKEDERILLVLYENLVEESEKEAKRICHHIGVDYCDAMIEIGQTSSTYNNADGLWYTKGAMTSQIKKGGVITGKNLLSRRDIRMIEKFVHTYDDISHYNLQCHSPTVIDKVRFQVSALGKLGIFMPKRKP